MKSFLLKNNKPVCKWGSIPPNTFFNGCVPIGYNLAVAPSESIIVLDVDVKSNKNGYDFIPSQILKELNNSFYYDTKSGGRHYFIDYTGPCVLLNTSTKYGLDLRVGAKKNNCGGYVKYNHHIDIRECLHLIKSTSIELNIFLELLFT